MYPFRPSPNVRIGETVDEFAHNWEVSHGGTCTDMLPHRDVNWQLFMWSESCEGPPPKYAPPGRKIDQYGNIIHDEPQVTPFQPGPPAVPVPPPPFSQASFTPRPPSSILTSFNPPYTPPVPLPTFPTPPTYPAPTPPPPTTTQPTPTPAPPPVVTQPAPGPGQVQLPPFPINLPPIVQPIPTGPFTAPPFPTPMIPGPVVPPGISWETAPAPAPAPAPTEQPSRWRELGVTLLMLTPALLPLGLTMLPRKRRYA